MSETLVKRLRTENSMMGYYDSPAIQIEAADEIERLMRNAKSDAQLLATYHRWCEMNGCAPSSRDLSTARAALGEDK